MRPRRPTARTPASPVESGQRLVGRDANAHRLGLPLVWLRLDRVVDDSAEIDDGDLENHHQEDQLREGVRATHRLRVYPPPAFVKASPEMAKKGHWRRLRIAVAWE
jgi:hypothetical protein